MRESPGIIDVYNKDLNERELKAHELPPGDERSKRLEIVEKVRTFIMDVERAAENGQRIRTYMLDNIELWMSRI